MAETNEPDLFSHFREKSRNISNQGKKGVSMARISSPGGATLSIGLVHQGWACQMMEG